jgi:hypothetical protein
MGMFCPGQGKPTPKGGPKGKHAANLQSESAEVVVLEDMEEQNASQIASAIVENVNAEKKVSRSLNIFFVEPLSSLLCHRQAAINPHSERKKLTIIFHPHP